MLSPILECFNSGQRNLALILSLATVGHQKFLSRGVTLCRQDFLEVVLTIGGGPGSREVVTGA